MITILTRALYATISTYYFAYLFNIRKEHRYFTAIGGCIAQLSFDLLLMLIKNSFISMFFAAIILAFYAEIMARVRKTPVTTFIIAALIPLVPGKQIYDAMVFIVKDDLRSALDMGLMALGYAGLLALGVMSVSTFSRIFLHKKK